VLGGECEENPANHFKIPDVTPVGFWVVFMQFDFDMGEGLFQLVQAEKGWPDTEKGFCEAVERDVAAVREKRINPYSPASKSYVSQNFVKLFRLTWRSGRAPSLFFYPAGRQGATGEPATPSPSHPRSGPWPDSQEPLRVPPKAPAKQ